jgi:hypothetical protein
VDEGTEEWRRMHNEELHDLYSSPNIIRVIKSRTIRWVGHVARMGEVHTAFWWRIMSEKYYFEDKGVVGRIILKLIFKK